jgi:hypothetical protein
LRVGLAHRRLAFGLALAISVAGSDLARAQPREPHPTDLRQARALFDQGMELTRQERWAEALERFRRSRDLVERPSTVYNMATVFARLGRVREALVAVRDLRRIADASRDASLLDDASDLEQRLGESVAQLTLIVTPLDAQVRVDGELVPGSGPRRLVLLDPGDHVVRVSAARHSATEIRLSALAGTRGERSIDLMAERAHLVVTSNVDAAQIAVDGVQVGVGRAALDVEPGPHTVSVQAQAYSAFERTVDASPGSQLVLDAPLVAPSEHPNWWLTGLGIAAWGAGWITDVVATLALGSEAEDDSFIAWAFLPGLGAWIQLGYPNLNDGFVPLLVDGIVQLVGIVLFVLGIVFPTREDTTAVAVRPRPNGLSLVW